MSTPADGIPWRPAWRLAAAMTNLKEQTLNPKPYTVAFLVFS